MKESTNNTQSDNRHITSFVSAVGSGDYARANKDLRAVIENKLLKRINNSKNIRIFNDERSKNNN